MLTSVQRPGASSASATARTQSPMSRSSPRRKGQSSVRSRARHALSSVAMSIASSAAAEIAERERERQRRSDAALAPMREAVARVAGRSAEEAAADERLWHVVQAALRRDLARANEAPAYTMWSVLEPEVELVRARLAALFGCDAEEVAITR